MAHYEVILWGEKGEREGKGPVTKYLDEVKGTKEQDWVLLNSKIIKLSQRGMEIVEGNTYKLLKHVQGKVSGNLIRIRQGRHRIYVLLTSTHLFLLGGEDKKTNKTPHILMKTIISRAQTYIN